jgi:hypothetical protein
MTRVMPRKEEVRLVDRGRNGLCEEEWREGERDRKRKGFYACRLVFWVNRKDGREMYKGEESEMVITTEPGPGLAFRSAVQQQRAT